MLFADDPLVSPWGGVRCGVEELEKMRRTGEKKVEREREKEKERRQRIKLLGEKKASMVYLDSVVA